MIVSSHKERPADGPVIVLPENKQAAKQILARGFETGKEPSNQVGRLECQSKILGILHYVSTNSSAQEAGVGDGRGWGDLVVDTPEGEVFWFVVFPEPFKRDVSFVVGVLAFPFVDGDA